VSFSSPTPVTDASSLSYIISLDKMPSISDYIQGEMDILFFAPETEDVVRAVNDLYGEEVLTKEATTFPPVSLEKISSRFLCTTSSSVERTCDDTVAPTPDRASTSSSMTESPLTTTVPSTPLKWEIKDLKFDMAGFSPDEVTAIQQKIERQRVMNSLTRDLALADSSKASVDSSSATNSPSNVDALNFLFDKMNQNDKAAAKREMKLQSLIDGLSKENSP
jgi:hypothetical protein